MTDATRTPKLLLIEDDDASTLAMTRMLQAEGWHVLTASTLGQGTNLAASEQHDVILLDRMLPDGDGIDVIASLRAGGSNAMILVISALGRAANRIDGLDHGADDYLPKPFEPAELIARIRALLRRRTTTQTDNDIVAFGQLQIRLKARTVHIGQTYVPLSPREFDLLVHFAHNHGNVVTRMQLLEHVWNLHFDPQTNVVDVHVSRLRRKLEDAAGRPYLFTERGVGYVLDPLRSAGTATGI